ncbi:MAG: metal-dependent hydrolase [Methanomicrobiales archaeon]|nr:metal-dependent hydrolase [Methanomicrobiales archaeon]
MDIFTHAVAILVILFATGNAGFIPFGVLGAVILDIDMAYSFISRRNPSLYLLFHGGFTHSVVGATILSAIAFGAILVLSSAGLLLESIPGGLLLPAFACVLAGAYLHLFLDYLASPGLPLLYPVTEKRFGLSLFPMPVFLLITVLGLVSLAIILVRGLTHEFAGVYGAIFTGMIVVSAGMKWSVHRKTHGRSFPTFHPFQWIVIREENASYSVLAYDMFRGVTRELNFEKYRNITPSEVVRYDNLPELRRHRYFSYITTVEKNGSEITFHDPVREEGLISFPPWYPSVTVSAGKAAS